MRLTNCNKSWIFSAAILLLSAHTASAQITPASGYTPPDDTPTLRVGVTIFGDYTYQTDPEGTDVDGNSFKPNQFNISRAYLNVTGNISHVVAFRVTPDITRETGTGSSLNGSLTYRLKYAYAQFNLDDWMARGSYARFGMQQTPYIDFIDSIYRYRFQGPTFEDREGFLSSADFGASFRYNFKSNYGDIHTGFYNGDNYNRVEANDQKAWMTRVTVRPLPMHAMLRGLRLTGFYNMDAYVKDGEKRRGIVAVTYEHPYVNFGFNYLNMQDQTRAAGAKLDGDGFSVFVTPKNPRGIGWEGLLRWDHLKQDTSATATGERDRAIAGIAYWFPRQGTVSTALMFDFENVQNDYTPVRPDERRFSIHMLVNF